MLSLTLSTSRKWARTLKPSPGVWVKRSGSLERLRPQNRERVRKTGSNLSKATGEGPAARKNTIHTLGGSKTRRKGYSNVQNEFFTTQGLTWGQREVVVHLTLRLSRGMGCPLLREKNYDLGEYDLREGPRQEAAKLPQVM